MLLPGRSAGHGRRPRWPLAAAWAVPAAGLLAIALLPRAQAHACGMFLMGGSAGSLIVVLIYARLLRRATPPLGAVQLLGGPWDGRVLLADLAGPVPEEVWLAGPGMPACRYRYRCRTDDRDQPRPRVLRYEPGDGSRPAAGL